MLFKSITLATLATAAVAQSPAYGQCGGQGWSGSKTCVSGYTCQSQGEYYSQCVPGSGKLFPTSLHKFYSRFCQVEAIQQPQQKPPPKQPHRLLPPTPVGPLPAAMVKVTLLPSHNTVQPIPGAVATAKSSRRRAGSTLKATTPPSLKTHSASVQ